MSENNSLEQFLKDRIAEAFRCLESGIWEHPPFDDQSRERIEGMKTAYGDVLMKLQNSAPEGSEVPKSTLEKFFEESPHAHELLKNEVERLRKENTALKNHIAGVITE